MNAIGWTSHFYAATDVRLPTGGRVFGAILTRDLGSLACAREAVDRLRATYPHAYVIEHRVAPSEGPQMPVRVDPKATIPRESA